MGRGRKKKSKDPLKTLTPKEIRKYRAAFNLFLARNSKDGNDTSITLSTLKEIMLSMFQKPTEAELKDMIKEVDEDGNGEIEFKEFLTLVVSSSNIDEELEMREAYRFFDQDMDSCINAAELQRVFAHIGQHMTLEECEQMVKEVDSTGEGVINYEDFVKLMKMPPVIQDDDDDWEDELVKPEVNEEEEDEDSVSFSSPRSSRVTDRRDSIISSNGDDL